MPIHHFSLNRNARTLCIHRSENGRDDIDILNISDMSNLEEITYIDSLIHHVFISKCPKLRYVAPMYNRHIHIEDCPLLEAVYAYRNYGRSFEPYFPGDLVLKDCPSIRAVAPRDGMKVDMNGYALHEVCRIFPDEKRRDSFFTEVNVYIGCRVVHFGKRMKRIDAVLALYKKLPEDLLRMLWTAIVH